MRLTADTSATTPFIADGYVAMEYPHNPHHPKQRYYLTTKGLKMLRLLQEK